MTGRCRVGPCARTRPRGYRAFTLVELIIASVVTAMVAATAIAVVEGFRQAAAMQAARSETIVRAAGVQAHMAQLALKSRMTLELSSERILLWTPAESLSNSGEGSEAAFDRIDLDEDELHWLAIEQEADGTWTLVEYTPREESVAGQDVFFTSDTSFWSELFASLRERDALARAPLASRLAPPRRMGGERDLGGQRAQGGAAGCGLPGCTPQQAGGEGRRGAGQLSPGGG